MEKRAAPMPDKPCLLPQNTRKSQNYTNSEVS